MKTKSPKALPPFEECAGNSNANADHLRNGDKQLPLTHSFNCNTDVVIPKWYAIYTRSRFEKKINQALLKSGFQAYLPLVAEKKVWSDRIKTVQTPLLPSYVFIKTTTSQFPRIYLYPGFVRFVSFSGKPCEIKQEEINLLDRIASQGIEVQQSTYCKKGDWVKVVRGPMAGWSGRVDQQMSGSRIVFQFDSLHQAISVEVCLSDIEKVERCPQYDDQLFS